MALPFRVVTPVTVALASVVVPATVALPFRVVTPVTVALASVVVPATEALPATERSCPSATAPEGCMVRAVAKPVPSALTLKDSALVPARPISARPEKPLCSRIEAVSVAVALFRKRRWSDPAWLNRLAGAATQKRFVASGVVPTPRRGVVSGRVSDIVQAPFTRVTVADSSVTRAVQPSRGWTKTQTPPQKAAMRPDWPAHAPVGLGATM